MSKLTGNNHQIYRERGRMNGQIAIVLAVFALLVATATVAKMWVTGDKLEAERAEVSQ